MADAPFVTGNDILSYTGNAGLASGAGNGIMPTQGDPYAGISSAIDRINETHAQKAIMDYQQKIDQQKNLQKMLAETDGSVFNMKGANGQNMSYTPLADDQPMLNEKAKELHDMVTAKPGHYNDNGEFSQAYREFSQLNNKAGTRAVAWQNYNNEAMKSDDPQERANILAWRDQELKGKKLGDANDPEPYLAKLPMNDEVYFPSKKLADDNNYSTADSIGTDAQGNQTQTTTKTLKPNVADFRSNIIPGTKEYTAAAKITSDYLSNINGNPALVDRDAKNIDAVNKAMGYVDADGRPISQHYIPHPADVVTQPDGTQTIKVNTTNPVDVAYALKMDKIGLPQTKTIIKKDKAQLDKEDLENQKTRTDITNTQAETEYKKGQTDHLGDEKTKPLTPAEIAENTDSKVTVGRVRSLFKPDQYQGAGTPIVMNTTKEKDGTETLNMRTVDGVKVGQALQAKGYDPKDWGVFKLPPKADVNDLSGIERLNPNDKTGAEQRTGETERADHQFMLKNNKTGEVKLAIINNASGNKKDADPELRALVNGREAVGNAAKAKHQYKAENSKLSEEISRNEGLWDTNGDVIKPTPVPITPAKSVTSAGISKTIGGTTYKKNSAGQWVPVLN